MNLLSLLSCANNINGNGEVAPPIPPPEDPTIFETFGANLKWFFDTEDESKITVTGDNSNELVSATSSDTGASTIISLSTQRTIWNKHSIFTRGETYSYVNSSTSLFNFLHQNAPSVIAFRIFIAPETTGVHTLFNSNNNQTTQRGIRIEWQSDNVRMVITKGTSGQTPINAYGPGGCTRGQWNDVIISDTGTVVTVKINGVSGTPISNAYTRGTGNAGYNMTMFRIASSGANWASDICLKNPMFINRLITEDEELLIRENYLVGTADFGESGTAHVFGMYGQSNMSGWADEFSGSPAYFDDPTGAKIWNRTSGPSNRTTNKFVAHQYPINANDQNQTKAGPDIEFAYRMSLLSPGTIYILKYAIVGTSITTSTTPNWYYGSNSCCEDAYDIQLAQALKVLKYELNKTVKIVGFLWRQGEANTSAPNEYYQPNFEGLLTGRFKAAAELHGFSVADCHIVVSSLDMYNDERPACHVVVEACQDVCDNATDYGFAGGHQFSTIGWPTSDGTHLTLTGQISNGFAYYDYLKDHL